MERADDTDPEAEGDPLEAAIERIEKEIRRVAEAIQRVEEKIGTLEEKLEPLEEKDELGSLTVDEKRRLERLSKEKEQLREKAKQLREKEKRAEGERLLLLQKLERLQVTGKSVRHALPPLAKHPQLSQSSSSTQTGHRQASFNMGHVSGLDDISLSPREPIKSVTWTLCEQQNNKEFAWSTEASIAELVSYVLKDVLYECGLARTFSLVPEMGTFELRPDLWVVRSGGLPVGVIEVKKPGAGVLNDKRVLGELYDYLLHLPNFYGAQQMIGIVTTYDEWRVCWLDTEETKRLMEAPVGEICSEMDAQTPQRTTAGALAETDKAESPPGVTPSKKRTDYHGIGEPDDETESDSERPSPRLPKRKMLASEIRSIKSGNVFPLIALALLKMSQVTHVGFAHPFANLDKRTLLRMDESSFFWDRLDPKKVEMGKWDRCPNANTKNLYLLEDFGVGAIGHAWLACSSTGAVCVLKFIKDRFKMDTAHARLEKECRWWHKVYPEWKKNVRVAKFCKRHALVMPHFDTPKRDAKTVELVMETLQKRFADRGFQHPDVRWRNIGVYRDKGSLKAIVFDLGEVHNSKGDGREWIEDAKEHLMKGITN